MKSVKFNFIMNMLLTVTNILFPLITFPYVSRILQAEGIGKVTFITSLVAYFILFAQLGIPTYGIRACAKVRNDKEKLTKVVQEIFSISIVTGILSYIALLIIYFSVDRINKEGLLVLILSLPIILNIIGLDWLYKALEKYQYMATRSIILKVIAVIMLFVLVKKPEDYIIYGAITVFGLSAANILNFINIRKHVDLFKIRTNYNFKQHLKPIWMFFALACATTIYTNIDTVMLGFIHTVEDVGYYTTSTKIKYILISIVTSLGVVLLPRLSFYIQNGEREKFLELSNKSFQFIMIIAMALTIYFIVYAKEIVYFLAGEGFKESILPMQIILPTVIFIGITNLFGIQILVPLGKEKLVVYSVVVGAIVSFVLNLVLIPKFSYLGTAIANLVAELAVLFVQVYFIRDIVRDIIKNTSYISIFGAILISSFTSMMSVKYIEKDFYILVVSSIVFFLVYYLVLRSLKNKFILDTEKQIFKRFLRR